MGRDHVVQVGFELFRVSIHAPAWGATPVDPDFGVTPPYVSIHAPAWGATGYQNRYDEYRRGFNPRARVGRDMPR